MQNIIEEIGLTPIEAKIYLTLVRKGPSLAGTITKETGIHRRTTYDILYRLRSKGLISNIILENKRYFEAVNPDRLLDIIKEKENNLKNILPELKEMYKSTKEKNEVLFFKGKKALKNILEDQINKSKEILFMGKYLEIDQLTKILFSRYHDKRIEKKLNTKILYYGNKKQVEKPKLSEIKFANIETQSSMSTYIYGDNSTGKSILCDLLAKITMGVCLFSNNDIFFHVLNKHQI